MKRREFIFKSITAGVAATTLASSFGKINKAFGQSNGINNEYDLVAIKGGEPEVMFRKAIQELGGISKFVKKGQKVLVKPNIGWDAPPERGANTNPKLVTEIIKQCLNAGAKDVYVFDHTCNEWNLCYKNSAIEKAVKDAGGKIVPGNSEANYQSIEFKSGTILKQIKVHELVLDTDVFINVPILKDHDATKLSISMKNLMGIVWDRGFWHRNDLHHCIAEFPAFKKPDLNIVDAYYVMKRNGPRGISKADVTTMKYQVISTDIVAADTASTKIFGLDPDELRYIKIAHDLKIGRKDLENLNIKRISL